MSAFENFIAEGKAAGWMGAHQVVYVPNGDPILAFVVPNGQLPNIAPDIQFEINVDYMLHYKLDEDDNPVRFGIGPGVAENTPLVQVLSPEGPVLEFTAESNGLVNKSVYTLTPQGMVDRQFLSLGEEYSEEDPDMGRVVFGGRASDQVDGTEDNDVLRSFNGADTLFGYDGDDLMFGDAGEDQMFGGAGNDEMRGGFGADAIYGGEGDDRITGGGSNDFLDGGAGDDDLFGNKGHDTLFGDMGDDKLSGGANNDVLRGDMGDDRLFGGDGRDALYGGMDDDALYGGKGNDLLNGGEGNDKMAGGQGADIFVASTGQDVVTDFEVGRDQIQMTEVGEFTFEDLFLSQEDSAAVIEAGDVVIRLENTDAEDLDETSFLL